jgi:dTMP kinase
VSAPVQFIVIEGPEGAGKSTQAARLAKRLESEAHEVVLVREPGGTVIGEQIRKILLDRDNHAMTVGTELLLYMAARSQLVSEVIAPALKSGRAVLADRFLTSTIVYQGIAGGLDEEAIRRLYAEVCGDVQPTLVVILDVPAEAGLARVGGERDRMESKSLDFHRRVRQGYLDVAKGDPARHVVIDASRPVDEVAEAVWQEVKRRVLS